METSKSTPPDFMGTCKQHTPRFHGREKRSFSQILWERANSTRPYFWVPVHANSTRPDFVERFFLKKAHPQILWKRENSTRRDFMETSKKHPPRFYGNVKKHTPDSMGT
jgi:hypothetical protein